MTDSIIIQMLNARIAEKNFILRDLQNESFYNTGISGSLQIHQRYTENAQEKIGFKDWDLLGQWRRAIHEVEQQTAQLSRTEMQESLLQLRRLEKDYLLRGDETYLQDIQNQIAGLRNEILKIPSPGAAVDETRRIAMGLRPSTLDDIGISETIYWFCRQFENIYLVWRT